MLQTPKGTRDILSEEVMIRQEVIEKIKSVFELYGFRPLETPALENWEVLSAKGAGGEEILKETYNFDDKAGRKIGLRYDLTIPLARFVAMNPNLPLPFKRYQIEKVWRYGDITRTRFREFLQADIDIIGSENMITDAEIIACTISAFNTLGFKNFFVRINSRKILSTLMELAGIEKNKVIDVFRIIDKLDKIGFDGIEKELNEKNIPKNSIKKLLNFLKIKGEPEVVIKKIEKIVNRNEGIEELKGIVSYLKKMKVEQKFKIDLSLARGLDYYTGPIYEVFAEEGIGSVAGGGRYDKLIGLFLGREIPATGISFGIERIMEVMRERKMIKTERNKTKVFVVAVNDKVRDKVLEIVQDLRKNNISADFDVKGRSLSKQLEYVNSLRIPYSIIVGEKELKKDSVKLRDMKTGKEKLIKIKELVKLIYKS